MSSRDRDRVPGNGFVVRHGYACKNTWYNPGWLHTGEELAGERTLHAIKILIDQDRHAHGMVTA